MTELTFYDNNPFAYGYSSKQEIIDNMNPLLKQLMEQNKGKVFCDVGCGCGRNLVYASEFAQKLIGIDLSTTSLAFAKEFVKSDNLELIEGDNLEIPLDENSVDLVVSDGVCHHTGNTFKAFSECVRILKPNGKLYLAVYKKYRYYPIIYYLVGGLFRLMNKIKLGKIIIDILFVKSHYLLYKVFKKQKLSLNETKNIFYDYFLTPIATFQSKANVSLWASSTNTKIVDYVSTRGNCHVFILQKNE